jgi:hypothetical protein
MSNGAPQFEKAEYSAKADSKTCKTCGQPISGTHYQINGAPACANCTQQIKRDLRQDSHASFVRGLLFGIGGAIVGLGIYVIFALTTGLVIGFVSLAVGYIVGKAIVMGSKGVGGRRYQVAAVLLTYMAVSLSAVPIALSQFAKQRSAQQQAQTSTASAVSPSKMSPIQAIGVLTMLGLASPFLALSNPVQGLIGLVILFVGIRIAWRMTGAKPVKISGPIRESIPAAPG